MSKTLIINGVEDENDLSSLGLKLAEKYGESNTVIVINNKKQARILKGEGDILNTIEYWDASQDLPDIALCLIKIYKAYQTAHPKSSNLAHAFVGQWLFHWNTVDGSQATLHTGLEHIGNGDIGVMRKSADIFIERDFGQNKDKVLMADGTKRH